MRVKIIQNSQNYKAGEVLVMDSVLAYKLIDAGIAILSKDMTYEDMKGKHGKPRRLRFN